MSVVEETNKSNIKNTPTSDEMSGEGPDIGPAPECEDRGSSSYTCSYDCQESSCTVSYNSTKCSCDGRQTAFSYKSSQVYDSQVGSLSKSKKSLTKFSILGYLSQVLI